jgi:hypothetical protein
VAESKWGHAPLENFTDHFCRRLDRTVHRPQNRRQKTFLFGRFEVFDGGASVAFALHLQENWREVLNWLCEKGDRTLAFSNNA